MTEYELACKLFTYDDGILIRKISRGNARKGDIVGTVMTDGRLQVRFGFSRNKKCLVHRIIWLIHNGSWPKNVIDHIDQDYKNNKIENLRDVLPVENTMNSKNSNPYCGVAKHNKKWRAFLVKDGIQYQSTVVTSKEEAMVIREQMEVEHYGKAIQ